MLNAKADAFKESPPRVSVVIPTYNYAHFLKDAIQSVLTQCYADYEIIVVDDGSTDSTPETIAQFGEKVRYIRQDNKGLSGARNTGIRAARGELIALLDSDDAWLPEFLSATVARMDSRPYVGAVHTGFFFVDESGLRLPQVCLETVPDDRMYDRLLDGEFFVPSSVVVRRECLDRVGAFDETFRGSEDWDIWLRVARKYRFAGISKPLLNYRMHGGNMSKDPDYMLRYQLQVAEKNFGAPSGPAGTWPAERQRAYATVYRYAAQGYYTRGDCRKGEHYLCLALETNPFLAESLDLFYELGCANQPLGRRGDMAHLDLEKNAAILLSGLASIFNRPDLSHRLRARKKTAFAYAYWALGLLGYGSDRMRLARTYLWQSVRQLPCLGARRRVWLTLAKSYCGRKRLLSLKSIIKRNST